MSAAVATTVAPPSSLHPAGRRRADARRLWFGLDALVTGANAVAYVALGGVLADHLGSGSGTYRAVGLGLLVFAIGVAAYAAWSDLLAASAGGWGRVIVALNAAWVAASLVVAASGLGDVTGPGRAWIAAQEVAVAGLTTMQSRTLRS